MRSRSSRLFIVLLHLVGVRTNLPLNSSFWKVGIVGVHPISITLDNLQLDPIGGLDGLLRKIPAELAESILGDPYWLQDELDGKCLGPMGFSECGDATLWILRRRNPLSSIPEKNGKGKRKKQNLDDDGESYDQSEYAIQLLDIEVMSSISQPESEQGLQSFVKRKRRDKKKSALECLMLDKGSSRKNKGKQSNGLVFNGEYQSLRLVPCANQEAWSWEVDGQGVISYTDSPPQQGGLKKVGGFALAGAAGYVMDYIRTVSKGKEDARHPLCIWRADSKAALAASCEFNRTLDETSLKANRLVQFSLIRYQMNANARKETLSNPNFDSSSLSSHPLPPPEHTMPSKPIEDVLPKPGHNSPNTVDASGEEVAHHLPHTMTSSESHSKHAPMHPELKPVSELLFSPLTENLENFNAASVIRGGNPLMMQNKASTSIGTKVTDKKPSSNYQIPSQRATKNVSNSKQSMPSLSGNKQNILHYSGSSTLSGSPGKISVAAPRKIPVHPYIKESKNGVWKDPQTDLEFLTDLSSYIGDDRKTHGRHTLMGVGQYTRTMLKIKVYGVALYVSKRDILADPNFIPFSTQSVEEIRSDMGLFEYLQKQNNVDRTLLIKLNMQLGVESIRSSLEADWQFLTNEHKSLLINSSTSARPALGDMLKKIQEPENSSRCSCSQSAEPEYNADETCCARGTEMAFTWRKDGSLEVRVDGRLMDKFAIPGLASGIFYEYLRKDDPMSMDALLNFANGFPFLLAPLAQVKGASVGQSAEPSEKAQQKTNEQKIGLTEFLEMMQEHANGAASWVQANIDGTVSNFARGAKSIQDAAHTVGGVMDRKRAETLYHMHLASSNSINFALDRAPIPDEWKERFKNRFSRLVSQEGTPILMSSSKWTEVEANGSITNNSEQWCHRNLLQGHYSCGVPPPGNRNSERKFGTFFGAGGLSDEIGVIIHPNSNFSHKIFMYTVHLYLLLLLIVSLPESTNTRIRTAVKRDGKSSSECSSDDEYSIENDDYKDPKGKGNIFEVPLNDAANRGNKGNRAISQDPNQSERTAQIKKSLSYFL